jgi:import receptor subunit TOM22
VQNEALYIADIFKKVAAMPAKRRVESSKAQSAQSSIFAVVSKARSVAWKLAKSTGKAGWITAATCLVLLVPLIIEMDREQQLVEFENQQLGALTGSTTPSK